MRQCSSFAFIAVFLGSKGAETDVIFELTPSELVHKLLRKDSYKLRHTRVKSKACFIFFAIWSKKGRYTEIGAEFGAEFGANLEFGSVSGMSPVVR